MSPAKGGGGRMGKGPKKATKTSKPNVTSVAEGSVFICKMGETPIEVKDVSAGTRMVDVLRRAVFPPGVIKGRGGRDISNVIEAAEADVAAGRIGNIGQAFNTVRVNAQPATLETLINPGDQISLIPNITGG